MKPHVKLGDIVYVAHPDVRNNGVVIVPAIVNQIFNANDSRLDTLVNLLAFPPYKTPQQLGSVTLLPVARTHEEVAADPQFVGCWGRMALTAAEARHQSAPYGSDLSTSIG